MGSLPASGIPVVTKTSLSFRKHDIRIKSTDSRDDTISVVTANRPSLARPIGSGSIVRHDGTVEYYEEVVVGAIRMARTCAERIASDEACVRDAVVDLAGNQTTPVIETSLMPDTPQISMRHTGSQIVEGQAVGDTVVRRIPASGLY
jgi:hypothetical protein